MAKLEVDDIAVDIQFARYYDGWVEYVFNITYCGEPLFKYRPGTESGRKSVYRKQGFFANDSIGDYFIKSLKKALDTGDVVFWEPLEPDISVEIWPWTKLDWKEKAKGWKTVETNSPEIESRVETEKINNFELTFIFDITIFYNGCGPALRLNVSRELLKRFTDDLEAEYVEFLEANKEEVRAAFRHNELEPPI